MFNRERPPTHPGELMREILDNARLPISVAAARMRMSRQTLSTVVHGRRAVTPETALRFTRLVGGNAELYLEMQSARDLWYERQRLASALAQIEPLAAALPTR